MKRILTLFAAASISVAAMSQDEQAFYGNGFFDNWYVGVYGGPATATTNQSLLKNINMNAGVRVAKLITPVFGLGVEASGYFSNKFHSWHNTTGTVIRNMNLGLFAQFNISNMINGYYGEPSDIEVSFVPGFYWGHNYGERTENSKINTLINKLAVDVAYNFGNDKQWQVYLEPSLNYVIAGTRDSYLQPDGNGNKLVIYNINSSYLQLNVGVNYKFLTSNGTHNFSIVQACDQEEIEDLNKKINDLRDKAANDAKKVVTLQKEQDQLEQDLAECHETTKPKVVEKMSIPDLPAVFYQVNRSVVTPSQQPNVAVAAEVLKNHPEYDLLIKGYASPEGSHDNNTSLGIRRAQAVKNMLVSKYKIDANRITAEGCGETDELFPIFEFNRVAMMSLQKKDK